MSSSQASSKQQPPGDSKAKCLKGLGPIWSAKEVKLFFQAYHEHGQEWDVVAEAVGTRTPENCESVFKQTQSFLSIPKVTAVVRREEGERDKHARVWEGGSVSKRERKVVGG